MEEKMEADLVGKKADVVVTEPTTADIRKKRKKEKMTNVRILFYIANGIQGSIGR